MAADLAKETKGKKNQSKSTLNPEETDSQSAPVSKKRGAATRPRGASAAAAKEAPALKAHSPAKSSAQEPKKGASAKITAATALPVKRKTRGGASQNTAKDGEPESIENSE